MTKSIFDSSRWLLSHGVLVNGLKLIITCALLMLVIRSLDLEDVADRVSALSPITVVGAALIMTLLALGHALRWQIVIKTIPAPLPYRETLRLVLIGYFFNQTLPSAIGGDAYRIWGAVRRGMALEPAAASVIVDRTVAIFALTVMVGILSPWLIPLLPQNIGPWIVGSLVVTSVLAITVLMTLDRFTGSLKRFSAIRGLELLSATTRNVLLRPGRSAAVLMLTITLHMCAALVVYFLAFDLDVPIRPFDCVLLFPIVMLVTVAPISIAGWGVREAAMVVALGGIGIPAGSAFSLSVSFGLVMMAAGLPGAILWLIGSSRRSASSDGVPNEAGR